jgi:hypothetical protein
MKRIHIERGLLLRHAHAPRFTPAPHDPDPIILVWKAVLTALLLISVVAAVYLLIYT